MTATETATCELHGDAGTFDWDDGSRRGWFRTSSGSYAQLLSFRADGSWRSPDGKRLQAREGYTLPAPVLPPTTQQAGGWIRAVGPHSKRSGGSFTPGLRPVKFRPGRLSGVTIPGVAIFSQGSESVKLLPALVSHVREQGFRAWHPTGNELTGAIGEDTSNGVVIVTR